VNRYPHRIRLRGPWECEPSGRPQLRMSLPSRWADGGLIDFSGRVRFRRRFGYPGQIDAYERVWLTLAGVSDRAEVLLNGAPLGSCGGDGPFEFEITRLLGLRNELIVDVEGTAERGGLWGETALEVRCAAYLRDVRLWLDGAVLHCAGAAAGEAERPLDLYVLLNGATAAYAAVTAAPEGTPFHIIAEKPYRPGERLTTAQVDLVNGAVVWYTTEREIAATG
jgi:hypothetical protein